MMMDIDESMDTDERMNETSTTSAANDISTSSITTTSSSITTTSEYGNNYDSNMKMFLQCIEQMQSPDEFEENRKHGDDTDAEDDDKFSDDCDLSSTPFGRPRRRRRAATFSFYPEKKEVRLISPVKKETSDFDEASAARFLMGLKAASSESNQLANNDNNYDDDNNTDNTINVKSNIVNFYRPRSNSLPDFGSKERDSSKSGYVGIYSPEARRKRIERFNEKRKHRVWKRNIKYDVRKNFADSRVRIKGRFVRKDEEHLMLMNKEE
jgi:hypothetical protein